MDTILLTAPYMIPFLDRFRPVLEDYGLELIVPAVEERMDEEDLLVYAGGFDGAICGDDRYTRRVLETCAPRLKVISKWGTGIDSIDKETCNRLGIAIGNIPMLLRCRLPIRSWGISWLLPAARPGWQQP